MSTSDLDLAVATKAIILGFNVKAPSSVKTYAENKNVEIRLYRVIYELIDDVRKAMEGLLDTVEVTNSPSFESFIYQCVRTLHLASVRPYGPTCMRIIT